ncbi:MAG: hypothetical protein MCS20_01420 [Candidatus Phytoplasma mali]|nr:hypothetical protein [Candidatus Phytoplasma mali]
MIETIIYIYIYIYIYFYLNCQIFLICIRKSNILKLSNNISTHKTRII